MSEHRKVEEIVLDWLTATRQASVKAHEELESLQGVTQIQDPDGVASLEMAMNMIGMGAVGAILVSEGSSTSLIRSMAMSVNGIVGSMTAYKEFYPTEDENATIN